ncbi:MAG TPA: hypothetical protein VFC78_09575 [Tepidisphaeraceae bacterium]|nr:hypothetical protein [Tepidisphaeraceae bacterium]
MPGQTAGTAAPEPSAARPPLLEFQTAHEIPGINTPYVEGASCMSPAGDFLYFASNRPGGFGKFDIWRSRVSPDWKFGPVENVGPEINTADNETDPALALNGYRLVFSSDRGSDTGLYQLLSSDSREVYSIRQGRPLPHLGMSAWLLLASLLLLFPLLFFLRGWDDRRLGLLQKCLLISLLAHVLLCLGLSFLWVSRDAYHYVRQQMGVEIAVNLNPAPEIGIGSAIRQQSTSDLPTIGAPPPSVSRSQLPVESMPSPALLEAAAPRARFSPDESHAPPDIARSLPAFQLDTLAAKPIAPSDEIPKAIAPELQFTAPLAPAPAAAPRQAQAVAANVDRQNNPMETTSPQSFVTPAMPTVQGVANPLLLDPGLAMKSPSPAQFNAAPAIVAPPSPDAPGSAPRIAMGPASDARISSSQAAPTGAESKRAVIGPMRSTPVDGTSTAKAEVAFPNAPNRLDAQPPAQPSVAMTGAIRPIPGPVVKDAAAPGTSNLIAAPNIDAPKLDSPPLKVASGKPDVPKADEASIGIARQATAAAIARPTGIDMPVPQAAAVTASSLGGPDGPPVTMAARLLAAGPATLPASSIAQVIGSGLAAPPIDVAGPLNSGANPVEDRLLATEVAAGPATRPSTALASTAAGVPALPQSVVSATAPGHAQASNLHPLALDLLTFKAMPGQTAAPSAAPLAVIPGGLPGPQITPPQFAAAAAPLHRPAAPAGASKTPMPLSQRLAARQASPVSGSGFPTASVDFPSAVPASVKLPGSRAGSPDLLSISPHPIELAVLPSPTVSIDPLPGDIGASRLSAPDAPFQMRAPETHKPIIEKLGGTPQSEEAVDKALRWLADHQEEDGRWTLIFDDRRRKRQRGQHDMALTGLPILAFLAQDHRPNKAGPYRDTVARGLDYLVGQQLPDGDLRGPLRGGGADQGNMYDHGIAAYAMAEAAIMTGDPRYTDAALRAARFIIAAQNEETGGWRYAPNQPGDTSVFGWQVMALKSAERIGFQIPEHAIDGIHKYMFLASGGKHHMLAGYLPHDGPSGPMTAQLAFSRMLMGQRLNDGEMNEASEYLSRQPPNAGNADLYYWYYASLCMSQMRTDAWDAWNKKTRDTLIALQKPDGHRGGYWDIANVPRADRAGRVFTTSLATLTLEVYYRYMPMQEGKGELRLPPK